MKRIITATLFIAVLTGLSFANSLRLENSGQTSQETKEAPNYDIYVGKYEVQPNFILTITNEKNKLMGQPTGDPKIEFKAEAAPDQFSSADNVRLKFVRDETGVVIGVVVTMDGKDFPSKKIK